MGGVDINVKGNVLKNINNNKYKINGLYAAGEIVGGLHGDNRLVGNSLLMNIVFGMVTANISLNYIYYKFNEKNIDNEDKL